MLILTRRVGETFVIGDNIYITITGIQGNQVKVGVDAPRGLPVDRIEVRESKDRGETRLPEVKAKKRRPVNGNR